ncbi:MAG: hypothetical protein WCA27_07340 [Candidatus Sulfotelmatobacter sp.]
MSITDFAEKYRLKVRRDPDDGTDIVPGTHDQSHIYEWNESELAVMFITPATKPARPFFWRKHRDSGFAAGMRLIQNGDAEGCLGFDPTRPDQVKIALKLAGVKRKRQISPAQAATLARFQFIPRQTA